VTRENRRFPSYAASIPVLLKRKGVAATLVTSDVSRHGAFVLTDDARGERELVQLVFRTPAGDVDAMCMIARVIRPGAGRPPGLGVDLFALAKDAKDRWESFVRDLKVRGVGGPVPAPAPEPATRREHVRHAACFLVKLRDKGELVEMATKDIGRGGTFLRTPLLREVGEVVEIVLVHPETDDEYRIDAMVVRAVDHDTPSERGLGLRFAALDAEQTARLHAFIDTGVEAVELVVDKQAARIAELRNAVAAEPDSPDAHEDLGQALLEAKDWAGAVDALVRAMVLAPSSPEIHLALSAAYQALGDVARAASHERVAGALTMYRADLRRADA
jgi:hypothetical protein